jgi:hypothetical protein
VSLTAEESKPFAAAFGRELLGGRRLDCAPTQGGDKTDGDSDSLPVKGTYTFSDCAASSATYSGGFTLTDESDSKAFPAAGFRLDIDDFSISLGTTNRSTVSVDASGFYNVSINAPTLTSTMEIEVEAAAAGQSASAGLYFDAKATATDAVNLKAGGTLEFSGFFEADLPQGSYTLQISSSGLTYATPCNGSSATDQFIKDGTLSIVDGDGNTVTGTFSNCTATWKFNDTTLSVSR